MDVVTFLLEGLRRSETVKDWTVSEGLGLRGRGQPDHKGGQGALRRVDGNGAMSGVGSLW